MAVSHIFSDSVGGQQWQNYLVRRVGDSTYKRITIGIDTADKNPIVGSFTKVDTDIYNDSNSITNMDSILAYTYNTDCALYQKYREAILVNPPKKATKAYEFFSNEYYVDWYAEYLMNKNRIQE